MYPYISLISLETAASVEIRQIYTLLVSQKSILKGRMMHILPGSEKREKKDDKAETSEKTSYKKEKMAKLKANAGKVGVV